MRRLAPPQVPPWVNWGSRSTSGVAGPEGAKATMVQGQCQYRQLEGCSDASVEKPGPFWPTLPVRPMRHRMAREASQPELERSPPVWLPPRPTQSSAFLVPA